MPISDAINSPKNINGCSNMFMLFVRREEGLEGFFGAIYHI